MDLLETYEEAIGIENIKQIEEMIK
jgi:hypothetical protein